MLEERGIEFTYREYRNDPLSAVELREVMRALGCEPGDVLRRRDPVYKTLGLAGTETADQLIDLMVSNPTLLQRPIGVRGTRAVLGRPVERLLTLID